MIFSSLEFLCVFLPVTYLLYTVLPGQKAKNGLLVVVSLLFYAYGEPVFVLLMLFSACMNYLSALWIAGSPKRKKFLLVLNLLLNFGILGVYHGLLLLLEEYIPFVKKIPKWIAHVYTLLAVCVGFVVFRADTVSQGMYFIRQMFTGFEFSPQAWNLVCQQMTPYFLCMFLVAVIGAAPIKPFADKVRNGMDEAVSKWQPVQTALYVLSFFLLAWCMLRLSGSTYNPFIYFRF
ncbi:MAG: hypothetical protein NC347_02940 [Clostridium sp.]|nr:hypothetical protein [Clostridium sp.]